MCSFSLECIEVSPMQKLRSDSVLHTLDTIDALAASTRRHEVYMVL